MTEDSAVLCQAVVESGKVSYNAIVRRSSDGTVSVSQFGRETHSTSAFNGVAIIAPRNYSMPLPASFQSARCREKLEELAKSIPESEAPAVLLVPFV